MKNNIGIIINRLAVGFTFAFVYQIIVGIATSIFSLPLTGNIQDLVSGIEQYESEQGVLFITWWIISTIVITAVALLIVRYKKFISPYKGEKDIDIPPRITIVTAVIVGASISFLFFLLDLAIGIFIPPGSTTDVLAIYEAASIGDFTPLTLSVIFSIAAGFIVVGVASKAGKVKELTKDVGITNIADIAKIVKNIQKETKTSSDLVGLHPGALVHVGKQHVDKVTFEQIEFDEKTFIRREPTTVDECLNSKEKNTITWTNVVGLHEPNVIEKIGEYYNLHILTRADIMNTELRPKIENYDDHLFVILKLPHVLKDSGRLFLEDISLVIGKNYVLSFQETEDDAFDSIRDRLEKSIGVIRSRKSDYLAYALADAIIDHFYVVLESIGITTENLEEELMDNPTPRTLQAIHMLKREMVALRKSIWPMREVIDGFERMDSQLIDESTRKYLRDVYNHTVQVMDNIEGLRDMIGGMLDTYLSSVSNKMNEVMKTLTVIASIFIPITFIAGIYGTNFTYIPELQWEGSYFVMLGVMVIIVAAMMIWFKSRKWV